MWYSYSESDPEPWHSNYCSSVAWIHEDLHGHLGHARSESLIKFIYTVQSLQGQLEASDGNRRLCTFQTLPTFSFDVEDDTCCFIFWCFWDYPANKFVGEPQV